MEEKGVSSIVVIAIIIIVAVAASSVYVIICGGYPVISVTVQSVDNEIRIYVSEGYIAAGEWAYSVSVAESSYSWTTGTEALDAPKVLIAANLAVGTYYVNIKHLDSGHVYFTSNRVITIPIPQWQAQENWRNQWKEYWRAMENFRKQWQDYLKAQENYG